MSNTGMFSLCKAGITHSHPFSRTPSFVPTAGTRLLSLSINIQCSTRQATFQCGAIHITHKPSVNVRCYEVSTLQGRHHTFSPVLAYTPSVSFAHFLPALSWVGVTHPLFLLTLAYIVSRAHTFTISIPRTLASTRHTGNPLTLPIISHIIRTCNLPSFCFLACLTVLCTCFMCTPDQ